MTSQLNIANRQFMKSGAFGPVMERTDQAIGIAPPPLGIDRGGKRVELPLSQHEAHPLITSDYRKLLDQRRSQREYTGEPISAEQLAFVLWSINSIQEYRGADKSATLRPVPSGGARHSFEVYFIALQVTGLAPGIYHYLPLANVGEYKVTIERIGPTPNEEEIHQLLLNQDWARTAGAWFFIATVPYRAEWRYGELAHRMILTDLGYVGQNFMLSATALGLGSCQIAGYNQELADQVLGLDGEDEFCLIAMTLGSLA